MQDTEPTKPASDAGFLKSDFARAAQKYFVVGGVSALLEWGIFALFLYMLDQHYLVSGTLSFILATGVNYFLSVRFVFGTGRRVRHQRIALLYAVSTIGIGLNLGVLFIGIDTLGLHEMVAKVLATASVFGWNFAARYYFVFQK